MGFSAGLPPSGVSRRCWEAVLRGRVPLLPFRHSAGGHLTARVFYIRSILPKHIIFSVFLPMSTLPRKEQGGFRLVGNFFDFCGLLIPASVAPEAVCSWVCLHRRHESAYSSFVQQTQPLYSHKEKYFHMIADFYSRPRIGPE